MTDLQLDFDEGIILQTSSEVYGSYEHSLYELVLTNKNIIMVYDKNTKIFSKEELVKAIEQYNKRDRRFGGVKEEDDV